MTGEVALDYQYRRLAPMPFNIGQDSSVLRDDKYIVTFSLIQPLQGSPSLRSPLW
jgi:hypothetical protein